MSKIIKAIVTGANGFIGSHLCEELVANGVSVIAVVKAENASIENIDKLQGIRIVKCDLSNIRNLSNLIDDRDIDVFYHLAWIGTSGDLRGNSDIQTDNVRYSCDAVYACNSIKCNKFVFASSIMAYEIDDAIKNDAGTPINSLYSAAKLSASYMTRIIAANLGLSYIGALISNVYGPGETSARLINTSLRRLLRGDHCSFTPGYQSYDFIYITDATKSLYYIGDRGKSNKTYYIGSLHPRQLRDYLIEMKNQVDESIEIGLGEIPFEGSSLDYNQFDLEAIKNDTGFEPEVSFAEGIKYTLSWLKTQMGLS